MADDETLKRILEIEREGREMMERAQAEAEHRVSLAREEAALAAKKAREERSRSLAGEFSATKSAVDSEFASELEKYRRLLDSSPLDRDAFGTLLSGIVREERNRGARP
jgi:vacuolar-type H+-ATPase subunit E/Vma4